VSAEVERTRDGDACPGGPSIQPPSPGRDDRSKTIGPRVKRSARSCDLDLIRTVDAVADDHAAIIGLPIYPHFSIGRKDLLDQCVGKKCLAGGPMNNSAKRREILRQLERLLEQSASLERVLSEIAAERRRLLKTAKALNHEFKRPQQPRAPKRRKVR